MFEPKISRYDYISQTDMRPQIVMSFQVSGTFGKGVTVTIVRADKFIQFDCVDGDTPYSVAGKIAAVWNDVFNAPENKIWQAGETWIVELISPPYDYAPWNVYAEYKEPAAPVETTTAPETVEIVEAIQENETKKNNSLLWLGAGGLLLFFLWRKKKKGAKS